MIEHHFPSSIFVAHDNDEGVHDAADKPSKIWSHAGHSVEEDLIGVYKLVEVRRVKHVERIETVERLKVR